MAKKQGPISPDTYGTADFVTEIPYRKWVEWGGFRALVTGDPEGTILIWASQWTGLQPRMCLVNGEPGHEDWMKLAEHVEEKPGVLRVVGSSEAAKDARAQWTTHGPSRLIGGHSFEFTQAP